MKFSKKDNTGFSIMEAALAAVIFAVAAAGIFSTIAVMRQPAVESEERIGAAYYAQQILEDLRAKVDQGNLAANTGDLSTGNHSAGSSGIYSADYVVTPQANGSRKVTVTVTWPD